jgi:ABC-type polysaccharide/polyol phosphate export permease
MKSKQEIRRGIFFSAVFTMFAFLAFSRLTGLENIRAIHIAILLICGMGIGVFLTNLFAYFRKPE